MDDEKRTPRVPDGSPGADRRGVSGDRRWPKALERPSQAEPPEEDPLIRSFDEEFGEDLSVPDHVVPPPAPEPEADRAAAPPETAEQPTAPLPAPVKKKAASSRPAGKKRPRSRTGRAAPSVREKTDQSAARAEKRKRREEPPVDPWEAERSYRPIRFRRDGRIGCLGGIMYAVFIICASILLAGFAWMSASDVLALNKDPGTVEITLPESIFVSKEVDVKDDDGNVTGTRTVRAADTRAVAAVLKDHGLINYKWLFSLYSRYSHADEHLDPGTYVLSTNLDYRALVKKMQAGADSQLQTLVMFPEGFNMDQIFARLQEKGVCSVDDLYAAAANTEFSYAFLEDAETGDAYRLEGFLFPDTYYFYQGMQASSAINKFLSNLHYRVTDEIWQQTKAMGLTFRQMITIASLIEREAADDGERATIASVIFNRLAAGMPLQIDSSVLYALRENGDVTLTPELIQATDSPYNTYLYAGLPPGPICNPGMNSILAALNPESTSYMYYALDTETGTHRFFNTLEEHEAFVATQNYG